MQRKNNFLNHSRNGFAMIMAIAVIVIIATILALSIALTTTTAKRTTDVYLYEQTALMAYSATEYALLRISQNPPCSDLDENFTQDGIYNIKIKMQYIYDSNASCEANGGTLYTTVTRGASDENGSVLVDVSVDVNDTVTTEPIRYFRRTLQKL